MLKNCSILMPKQPEMNKSLTLSKMLMELCPKLCLTASDFPRPLMSKRKVRDEMLRKCHNLQLLHRVRGERLARWQGKPSEARRHMAWDRAAAVGSPGGDGHPPVHSRGLAARRIKESRDVNLERPSWNHVRVFITIAENSSGIRCSANAVKIEWLETVNKSCV